MELSPAPLLPRSPAYNPTMSLKHVDLESALRRLAEKRIEDAMREGKFDNLAGSGKPLDLEPMPADENARMMWWMLRILKNNNFTPEEVRWRRQIEGLKEELARATTEQRVEVLVKTINGLVHQLNTLGTNAINLAVAPVSLEHERQHLHERLAEKAEEDRRASKPSVARPQVSRPPHRRPEGATIRECANARCKTRNPTSARFCRRCGKVLPGT
jgi:regulator of replication initiation timing